MTLQAIGDTILSESSSPQQQRDALDEFAQLCSAVGGVVPDPCFDAWAEDSLLDSGVAISPQAAAHCVRDYRRSVVYIRAVHAAIHAVKDRFPGVPIRILYAGCGPYATLLLPLLGKFEPGELELHLLDIHEKSLRSLRQLIQHFDFGEHGMTLLQADASRYQHPEPVHIIIAETMQKALEQEPQLVITAQLAPQLCAGGIFIPKEIQVELVLRGGGQQYSLGNLLTLRPDTGVDPEPIELQIPTLPGLDQLEAALLTRIQVYGEQQLLEQDAEITLPRPFPELSPLKAGQYWEVRYQTGPYPCFEVRPLGD